MKKIVFLLLLMFSLSFQPVMAAVGDRVITLGADLTPKEKQDILAEFNQAANDKIIVVTFDDEVHYFPGTTRTGRELSSSLITFKDKGNGIQVTKSSNITQVSNEMYQNALLTAGIQDADISVTAPEPVSGTAALTGIFKAFETTTGKKLNTDRVQAANQEITDTAKLGQNLGDQKLAADFIKRLKEEVQKNRPQTDADYQNLIEKVAKEMGIQLTPEQIQSLVDLLKKLNSLNIDWASLGSQLQNIGKKVGDYTKEHPQQVNAILDFFKQVITSLQHLISSLFS